MKRPLVIFGASSFAEIVGLYFARGEEYEPVAYCVDDEFAVSPEIFGLPLIPLSELLAKYSPDETAFHVAVTYTHLNRLRLRKVAELKALGFSPASYVSSAAYVDPSAVLGEHVFIFEDNTVQPLVTIGDGTILWSGNHIGHHSQVGEGVFISSHVVVSGHCSIGDRTFIGVNASIGNNVSIGIDNWILPGTVILSDTGDDEMWRPQKPALATKKPTEAFLPK